MGPDTNTHREPSSSVTDLSLPKIDQFNLERFVVAQSICFDRVVSELTGGEKESCWMWYIFPQIAGLGSSFNAQKYAIHDKAEATAYLQHEVLGARLIQCCELVLKIDEKTAEEIFGFPDDLKLCSCMTLFSEISESGSLFQRVLEKFYNGSKDQATLDILASLEK